MKRDQQYIQAAELFTNQQCPVCTSFLQVWGTVVELDSVFIELQCLHCNYKGIREIIGMEDSCDKL